MTTDVVRTLVALFRALSVALLVLPAACNRTSPARDTAASTSSSAVRLTNGANAVDLLGGGSKGEIFVAWRGNYNAHGFSTVAFYVRAASDRGDSTTVWQLVPFFGGSHDADSGRDVLRTFEGADCTLGDLRVVSHGRAAVEVILATREMGESFADSAAVRFEYYGIKRNTEGLAGWPPVYFEQLRTVPAKRAYCDVNEAFARELGLGTEGLGHGEGGR